MPNTAIRLSLQANCSTGELKLTWQLHARAAVQICLIVVYQLVSLSFISLQPQVCVPPAKSGLRTEPCHCSYTFTCALYNCLPM